MTASRIAYLRDKLTQMGHPPANRILWENELRSLLLEHPEQREKPDDWPERPKPFVIRGSAKPKKLDQWVKWNVRILEGFKESRCRMMNPKQKWLPAGYFRDHSGYVIPPYLRPAHKLFCEGKEVYGRRWLYNGHAWNTKSNRKHSRSNPEVRAQFMKDVGEFFNLCPCVPFAEARWRFPEAMFLGTWHEEQKEKEKAKREAKRQAKRDAKAAAHRKMLEEQAAKARATAERNKGHKIRWEPIDKSRKIEQWKRIAAGKSAWEAKNGKIPPVVNESWWPGKLEQLAQLEVRRARAAAARVESSETQ